MKNKRIIFFVAILLLGTIIGLFPVNAENTDDSDTVHLISIKGEITPAMSAYLKLKIDEANMAEAEGIIIDISTLGGRVDAAVSMKDAIIKSEIPVVVFVGDEAISAGALITIAADTIIMAPGSNVGSAEPIPLTEKSLSYVRGVFYSTAEDRGRDPEIAAAMADKGIEIKGLIAEGKLLNMSAQVALEHGYADAILSEISEIISFMDWPEDIQIVEIIPDYKITIAQFLTRSDVSSILLTIGMIAIIIEIMTQGFGVAGMVGISAYILYFSGGMLAGNTQWWSVLLFVVGIILLLVEATVPGFGAFGFGGIAAMLVSIVFAAPDPIRGATSLGIAIVLTVVITPILFKYLGKTNVLTRLVLSESETVARGYTSNAGNEHLLGKTGKTITPLRPSGTIMVDGVRLDAITEGGFLTMGVDIKIIRVEGHRIVVCDI